MPEDLPPVTFGKPECRCTLHEVSTYGRIEYVRGFSNGCQVHPASAAEVAMLEAQRVRQEAFEAADRAAREAARRAE